MIKKNEALNGLTKDEWSDRLNEIFKVGAITSNNLAFVDAKAIMNQLSSTGIVANNFTMTSQFVFGGSFSLDGVHPSPRGYALISNECVF